MYPHRRHVSIGRQLVLCDSKEVLCGYELTHGFHTPLYTLFKHERLARMNDIDDRTRSDSFQILQENTSVASIRYHRQLMGTAGMERGRTVWRVDTLGREVCELLEVCIPVTVSSVSTVKVGYVTNMTISFS